MSKSLMKRPSDSSGVVPGVASLVLPGLGQLINREGDKALGVFAVWAIAGIGALQAIPIVGWIAGTVAFGTHAYAVVDGYLTGRKNR